MSRPRCFLYALTLIAALAAPAAQAQLDDAVGIYFDPAYTITEVENTDVPHLATAYLVLMNPTETAGGLGGWECRIEHEGYQPQTMWTVSGNALNFKTPPDFVVAMTQPLPITGPNVLLASFDMLIDEPTPFRIELVPLRHAPSVPDAMSYIPFDDKEQLTPMTNWTGEPTVATYNWVPYCDVDAQSLLFMNIVVGTSQTEHVTVTNIGGAQLVVDPVIEGSGEFSITNYSGPFYLDHGESRNIYVRHAPTDEGRNDASLVLGTGCGPVLLSGQGHEPVLSYSVFPDSLDFGDVAAGGMYALDVTFINNGDYRFTVEPDTDACSNLGLFMPSSSVPTGTTRVFEARISPTTLGAGSCVLDLGPELEHHSLPVTAVTHDAESFVPISTDRVDFGDHSPESIVHSYISLTNNSSSSLLLRADTPGFTPFRLVSPSEGYLIEIAPGATQEYSVRFSPQTAGEYSDRLVFEGLGLSVDLEGTCSPVPGSVTVEPQSISFGNSGIGIQRNRTVWITNYRDSTIVITPRFEPEFPEFSVFPTAVHLASGEAGYFTVGFLPTQIESYSTSLVLLDDLPVVPITGSGTYPSYSGVTVDPPALNFGLWPVGADAELEARVSNRGWHVIDMDVFLNPAGAPFVLSAGGSVGVLPPNSTAIIRVRFQPTAAGNFNTQVNLGAYGSPAPIAVTASAQLEVPTCILSTTNLQFPPTGTGLGTSLDLTVSNGGTAPMYLNPTTDCAAFSGLADPEVLAPGETGTVTVIFAPDEVGDYDCELTLGGGYCTSVSLEGTAFVGGPSGNTTDLIGVYFDGAYTMPWIFDVEDGDQFEAYLVLKNPAGTEDVTGYECRILDTEEVLLQGMILPAGAYNFSELPELTVGLGTPVPVAPQILLGTMSYRAMGVPDNAPIALVPKRNPSIPDAMAMISGPEHILRPIYPDSGQPVVAWVNYWDRSVGNDDPVEEPDLPAAPQVTGLLPNVPNPFNPETAIRFEVAREGRVRIDVYDVMGRRVASLLDEVRGVGSDQVTWQGRDDNGRSLPSGAYYVRMETVGNIDTRKVMLLK